MDTERLRKIAIEHFYHNETQAALALDWYIPLLYRHQNIHKDDIHFRVDLQPGYGFGHIFCLETECRKWIPLEAEDRAVQGDGGHERGFGSFKAYQQHVKEDAHERSRKARLAVSQARSYGANATPSSSTATARRLTPFFLICCALLTSSSL
ncbi:hypothetical protein DL93DRAFT_600896 [Clavulina sp. PMI_390]|nr:hypothetical protein DL93DRAFT_600896 [Clavulina sp. PMI_390]